MSDRMSRLSGGWALAALAFFAALFALFTMGPTAWARGQVNLFMRDLAGVWTADTLIPTQDACPPTDATLTQRMAAHLNRAEDNDPNILLHQGELACAQGDRARARQAWEAGVERIPSEPLPSLFAAIAAFPDNNIINSPYRKEIGNYGAKQGSQKEREDDLSAAVDWYEFSFAYAPSGATAGKLAALYQKLGQNASVEQVWERLRTAFSSDSPEYWWAVGQAAEQQKDWSAAAQAYHEAASLTSGADAYKYLLREGLMWLRVGKFDQSEAAYQKAIKLHPDKIDGYLGLGDAFRSEKKYREAQRWYEKAGELFPEDYRPAFYLGLTARSQKHDEDALSYFDQALALKPGDAGILYYNAVTLDAMKRRGEAIATLSQAIERHPNPPKDWQKLLTRWKTYPTKELDPAYWAAQARDAEGKEELAQALTLYEKAASLALGEDAYPYWLRIGSLRIRLRDYEGAEEAYRRALTLNDQAIDPYIGIGESYRYRDDAREAETWYRKAQALAPNDWRPLYFLGLALYKQGRYEEALESLNQSLSKHPENAWGEYFRALSLKQLGKAEEAIASLEKAISLHKQPPQNWRKQLEAWKKAP